MVVVGSQLTTLFQYLTDGVGGERASKSIRLDLNKKLSVLGMPCVAAAPTLCMHGADELTPSAPIAVLFATQVPLGSGSLHRSA